jgi:hypothetical protein
MDCNVEKLIIKMSPVFKRERLVFVITSAANWMNKMSIWYDFVGHH